MFNFFCLFIAFLSLIFLKIMINFSNKLNAGPREFLNIGNHLKKGKIPSFGGLIFYLIIPIIIYFFGFNKDSIFLIMASGLSGLIGFYDDLNKRLYKKGISASRKFLLQGFLSLITTYLYYLNNSNILTDINFGFFKIKCGIFYIFWITFVIISTTHAVNLTDGIDGLATSQSILILLGFISLLLFFKIKTITLISSIYFIIILLIFYYFNRNPAKIFMGDIGSLFIGGFISSIFIIENKEILLIFSGITFIIETLSVIFQYLSFKFYKKRLFPISPIHHTFEHFGYKERSICCLFGIIGFFGQIFMIIYSYLFFF